MPYPTVCDSVLLFPQDCACSPGEYPDIRPRRCPVGHFQTCSAGEMISPQLTGKLLAAVTVFTSVYCLCCLIFPHFYGKTSPVVHSIFLSPLVILYIGAFGVLFLLVGSLCIAGILMLQYDDPRLRLRGTASLSRYSNSHPSPCSFAYNKSIISRCS